MTPREVLIAAKALIDTPEKWGKDGFVQLRNGTTCYCVEGAVMAAMGCPAVLSDERPATVLSRANMEFEREVLRFIANSVGTQIRLIPDWNDAPERTHAEVMDAFTRAIELAADAETVANLNRDLAAEQA